MILEAEISRAAAALAQDMDFEERFNLAKAVNNASTLDEISEPYKSLITTLIEKKEFRHLPGQHNQLTHGSGGGGGNYKAGEWKKANAVDKKTILDARYGAMADKSIAQGVTNLSRDEIIKEAARVDENTIDKGTSEVWINGSNHTISFAGNTKKMDDEDKKALFDDVDKLQNKYPVEQLDIEVVADWRGTNGVDSKTFGYTSDNGKKIVLRADRVSGDNRFNNEKWTQIGIVQSNNENYMSSIKTSSNAEYLIAHEWGHAIQSKFDNNLLSKGIATSVVSETFNNSVKLGISKGVGKKGSMSKYGNKNNFESYAEGFADFYLTNGKSSNAVTQELAKEFKW
jgi:hypothetical protein